MKAREMTAEYVRERLDYDPETGIFTWRRHFLSKLVGQRAGGATKNGPCDRYSITISRENCTASRLAWLIMTGEHPKGFVTFRNGDRLDLRWDNLIDRNRSEFLVGRSWSKTSSYRGVTSYKGRWVSQIGHDGVTLHLGGFDTPEEAARAYDARAQALYGDFARLNFPGDTL